MRANQAGWVVFVGTIAVLDGACSGRLIVDRGPGSGGAGATASGGATSGAAGSAASAGSGAVASSGGSSGSGAGGAQGGSGGSFGSGGVGGTVVLPATGAELPPLPPPVCGGVQCKESEDCCLLTVKCFDKTERSACPAPSGDAGLPILCGGVGCGRASDGFYTFCASNTDCAADSYCYGESCAGPGFCQPRTSCYDDGYPSCACDGKTYANNCESSLLGGVRTQLSQSVPCGTTVRIGTGSDSGTGTLSLTPCGFDSQCGSGEKCCAIFGLCYDASRPVLCTEPPPGTSRSCETQADCIRGEFCDGPGCTGPGGCRPIGSVKCDPLLKAVCGCDGQNYGNASCAKNAGSRVASEGACPL